eukprot:7417926-Pyramimonas_sp.AAC.1
MSVLPCVNRSAKRSLDHRSPSSALRCCCAVHLQALALMKSIFTSTLFGALRSPSSVSHRLFVLWFKVG